MNYALKMMAIVLSLCLFSNLSNAIGFKLNCEINEFKKLKNKSKSKLLDLVNIHQTHEFIGRDVKLSRSNLFGELKYNGLHYGKKLEWIHYVDDLIVKYAYYAHKSKIGQGRLNIEASYRKKPFQEKKILFDHNGTCFFQKIEKRERAEAENKSIIKEDKKTITASKKKQKSDIDIQTIACALFPLGHCRFLKKSNEELCESIIGYKRGVTSYDNYSGSFSEAKRRGLDCGDNNKTKTKIASNINRNPAYTLSSFQLCSKDKSLRISENEFDREILRRNLDCSSILNRFTKKTINNISDTIICNLATLNTNRYRTFPNHKKYVMEAKRRDLNCGVDETKSTFASQENRKSKTQIYKNKSNVSRAEFQNERQKRLELERQLAEIKNKQKQKRQRIKTDNQEPIINAFTKQTGSNITISGRITDNTEIAEVFIDGEQLSLTSNGIFKTELYIPRSGLIVEIVAYDRKGNRAAKLLKIERSNIQQATGPTFDKLNPIGKRGRTNPNALALIIGISDYENTKASALYADIDAKMFYDYANLKLGIPSSNIKELVGNNAKRLDIFKSVRSFLLKRTVTDKTDIYVFFAGHGLATDDGKDVYLLPYDGDPEYLEDSAIKRKKLFTDIQATKPRSVTVFLDTCYSGETRNEETLVAGLRPIIITAKEQAIPSNFTVLSAAQGNQTSQSLEEVKHGLFSYYTMLGMEGGADSNNDNKITAKELHVFIKDKVERQSQFRQTPELQGDKNRVLIQFN